MPKTTITLKDEVYDYVKKYGRRKISQAVNDALMKQISKPRKSMFGADPWLTVEDLRDETRQSPMRLLEPFAWIEYFMSSKRGSKVKSYVDGGEFLYTPSICLTEVKARYLRDGRNPEVELEFMADRAFILPLGRETALLAAEAKQSRGLHTIDAAVCATAQERKLTVVTSDQHFKGLHDVEMI